MNEKQIETLNKINEKLKGLDSTKYHKIIALLTAIYSNYDTPSEPINDTFRKEIKTTLKINNKELVILEMYFKNKLIKDVAK